MKTFRNLLELQRHFNNELTCIEFIEQQRWGGKPVCPHCGSEHHWRTKTRFKSEELQGYKDFWCKACNKKFTTLTGSIYDSSKVSLQAWICAVYLVTAHKKGISSVQLGKDLGVTQKTAWFMLHRIREMVKDKYPSALNDIVEVDETYIGGKFSNMNMKKRAMMRENNIDNKVAVMGMTQRGGNAKLTVIGARSFKEVINENIDTTATVVTDSHLSYVGLDINYAAHLTVNHTKNEYRNGLAYTNTAEGFFSYLKRSIYGIYHSVSPKHLQRYCDENAYRYNTRKIRDNERFESAMTKCGESMLPYKTLINK